MTGEFNSNDISFKRNGREIKFTWNAETNTGSKGKGGKIPSGLNSLFNAVANLDGDKNSYSQREWDLLVKLRSIFDSNDAENNNHHSLDADDIAFVKTFKNGDDVEEFINDKFNALNQATVNTTTSEATQTEPLESTIPTSTQATSTQATSTQVTSTQVLQTEPAISTETPEQIYARLLEGGHLSVKKGVKGDATIANKKERLNRFNEIMQTKAEAIKDQKETLTNEFTVTARVGNGKYLYNIAEEALTAELGKKPTTKEINDRIAEIALVNGIEDVNNVSSKIDLKVGRVAIAPVGGKDDVDDIKGDENIATTFKKPESKFSIKEVFVSGQVTEIYSGDELKDITLPEKSQVWVTNNQDPNSYAFEYNIGENGFGKKVYLSTLDDVKQLLSLKEAENSRETKEELKTRTDKNYETIKNLLKSADPSLVQYVLDNGTKFLTKAQQKELKLELINTMNKDVLKMMVGQDGSKFAEFVKDSPELQKAIANVYGYVNSLKQEDLEKAKLGSLKPLLRNCVNKEGVKIAEKKDDDGNITTYAKAMYIADDGQTYWLAKFDNKELKANDADKLNSFLVDLAKGNAITDGMVDLMKNDKLLANGFVTNFLAQIIDSKQTVSSNGYTTVDTSAQANILNKFKDADLIKQLSPDAVNIIYDKAKNNPKCKDLVNLIKENHPLNDKLKGDLTPELLNQGVVAGLVKKETLDGINVFTLNDKYYEVKENTVQEMSSAKYLALYAGENNIKEKNFVDWFGKEDNPKITKDNVIELLNAYNEKHPDKGLIEKLDDVANGLTKEQMNKIVSLVLDNAAEFTGSAPYKELERLMKKTEGLGGDYASGVAAKIDKHMNMLLKRINLYNEAPKPTINSADADLKAVLTAVNEKLLSLAIDYPGDYSFENRKEGPVMKTPSGKVYVEVLRDKDGVITSISINYGDDEHNFYIDKNECKYRADGDEGWSSAGNNAGTFEEWVKYARYLFATEEQRKEMLKAK